MAMSITSPILYGLGARILYNQFTNASTSGFTSDNLLQGAWQGVLLCYFWTEQTEFSPAVAVGIAARVAIDYFVVRDATKSWTLVLGTFGGVLTASLLGKLHEEDVFLDDDNTEGSYKDDGTFHHGGGEHGRSRYSPIIRNNASKRSTNRGEPRAATRLRVGRQPTSLEVEVESLRSKAAAADAKRRRCENEQKFARAQGNHLRYHQLAWQIERYTVLADSYGKEADSKLVEEDVYTSLRRNGSVSVEARLREYVTNGWNYYPLRDSVVENNHFGADSTKHADGDFASAPFRPTSDEWSRALD